MGLIRSDEFVKQFFTKVMKKGMSVILASFIWMYCKNKITSTHFLFLYLMAFKIMGKELVIGHVFSLSLFFLLCEKVHYLLLTDANKSSEIVKNFAPEIDIAFWHCWQTICTKVLASSDPSYQWQLYAASITEELCKRLVAIITNNSNFQLAKYLLYQPVSEYTEMEYLG